MLLQRQQRPRALAALGTTALLPLLLLAGLTAVAAAAGGDGTCAAPAPSPPRGHDHVMHDLSMLLQ